MKTGERLDITWVTSAGTTEAPQAEIVANSRLAGSRCHGDTEEGGPVPTVWSDNILVTWKDTGSY